MMRLVMGLLLLFPALALGQAKQDEKDKISNDNPGRPLQMPPASTEAKEAIDDFERFQRRNAWERALKSLYTIPEAQIQRFVDGENGFIIPILRKRRAILAALPSNGRAACRLFYDAEAKRLFDEADGPLELKNLETIYSAYFITSVGDNAADRLGDLYFEMGRFDRAADCWLAVLRESPDTDLSPALLSVKAALALSRAGRESEFAQLRTELTERYGDDKISIAGQTAAPAEQLRRLLSDETQKTEAKATASNVTEPSPNLGSAIDPVWQTRFADSIEAGMTPPEMIQWESNPLSTAVPAVTVEGSTLFANYLGFTFAIDLKSGKLLWRSGSFHHLEMLAMQDAARMVDSTRFAIVASGSHLWSLGRDLKEQNFMAPFRLICRRADSGETVWQSSDLNDYALYDLVGPPILVAGKLFITAKTQANPQQQQGPPQQLVLAIQPHDGKLLWKTEVGTFRQAGYPFFYYYARDPSPQPQLVHRAGALFVDTHVGILAKLDVDTGVLDWGYGYRTDAVQGQSRMFFFGYNQQSEPTTASSAPLQAGEAFLVKGMQSDRIYAVDPNRMKVLWERPISKSSRLLGTNDRTVFLGGPELSALDLKTRELLWATRVPNGSADGHLLVRPDGLWQLTPRGVFEIDPQSGAVRRIFRGKDLGAVGGNLFLTDQLVLAISNRTISAYPRRGTGAEVSVREDSAAPEKRTSHE